MPRSRSLLALAGPDRAFAAAPNAEYDSATLRGRSQPFAPQWFQDLEERKYKSARAQRQSKIVDVQRAEAEEAACERPEKRQAQHRCDGNEHQCERSIGPAKRRNQRGAERAVDKNQADNRTDQREERQCSNFGFRHTPLERYDEDDGDERKCKGTLKKTPANQGA